MGVIGFFGALVAVLMGIGRWHETGSPYWLVGSLVLLVLTLVGALQGGGGGGGGGGGKK